MTNKLAKMIDELGYDELNLLKKDFEEGVLRALLDDRLRALENPMLVCPVCERPVNEETDLVLIFGPSGLRQKARFCGKDCLRYFLDDHGRRRGGPGAKIYKGRRGRGSEEDDAAQHAEEEL